jgi:hypothetical protein
MCVRIGFVKFDVFMLLGFWDWKFDNGNKKLFL